MYKLLTPFRSIRKNASRYTIFGILLILLLALLLTVQTIGDTAKQQTDRIIERYACTYVCFNPGIPYLTIKPTETVPNFHSQFLPSLPYVAYSEIQAFHRLNHVLGLHMIGTTPSFITETPLEGRIFENDRECCINESYAKYLRESGTFTGIGDTISVIDEDNRIIGYSIVARLNRLNIAIPELKTEDALTVVGILADDATPYHNPAIYSRWRIYTTTEEVGSFFEGSKELLNGKSAADYWRPTTLSISMQRISDYYCVSDDGNNWMYWDARASCIRSFYDSNYSLEEFAPNEGYVSIAVVDSPDHAEAFARSVCCAFLGKDYSSVWDQILPQYFQKSADMDGKVRDWYSWRAISSTSSLWYALPLVAQTETLAASLAPIAPLCEGIARAATAATVILILLMTILMVHDRQYEIGVLRCMGVTSGGVCGRFVAEILVFLVIVAAIGLALAVPAARLAAGYLGLGDALGSVFATAGTQLALIAAATVVSCVLASAMILAKRPMEILNSRT